MAAVNGNTFVCRAPTATLNNTLWKSILAVKAGNVYEFLPNESWLYTGPITNEQIIDNILKSLVK